MQVYANHATQDVHKGLAFRGSSRWFSGSGTNAYVKSASASYRNAGVRVGMMVLKVGEWIAVGRAHSAIVNRIRLRLLANGMVVALMGDQTMAERVLAEQEFSGARTRQEEAAAGFSLVSVSPPSLPSFPSPSLPLSSRQRTITPTADGVSAPSARPYDAPRPPGHPA